MVNDKEEAEEEEAAGRWTWAIEAVVSDHFDWLFFSGQKIKCSLLFIAGR